MQSLFNFWDSPLISAMTGARDLKFCLHIEFGSNENYAKVGHMGSGAVSRNHQFKFWDPHCISRMVRLEANLACIYVAVDAE